MLYSSSAHADASSAAGAASCSHSTIIATLYLNILAGSDCWAAAAAISDCDSAVVTFLQGIPSGNRRKAVEQKIEEMGLRQYCDRPAGGYSGGNRRKLSVAMAMIGDPQV